MNTLRNVVLVSLSLAACFGAVSGLAGCAQPEEAPKELSALARFFVVKFLPEGDDLSLSDVELQDGIEKLHAALDGDALSDDEPQQGLLDNLTDKEAALSPYKIRADKGQGMFIANVVHCTLEQMEEVVENPDQLSLYPEAYESYSRDIDDNRPEALPTWTVNYKSAENALIQNQFTASIRTGLRAVPAPEAGEPGRGPSLVRAGFLAAPAEFEEQSDEVEFSFDVQVESYHERAPGELVHFYGMWRYMKFGILGNSYDQHFIDQTRSGMIDWDKKTDELCAR